MRVTLFIPCFIDSLYPHVGMAIVQVLERLGHTVEYPERPDLLRPAAFQLRLLGRGALPWPRVS